MICVFDPGNTAFEGNGNAVLTPMDRPRVKMVAGGNYDMQLTHPIDPEGKWTHLVPDAVIRVPVPEEEIENAFAGYDADVYKVTGGNGELRESATAPTTINYPTWPSSTAGTTPAVGAKSSYQGKNWECTYWDPSSRGAMTEPPYSSWYKEIPRTTPGAPVLVTLPAGTDLYFVEDYNANWYKMSTYYGIVGYIQKSKVVYDRHLTPSETKPRIITTQLLRITNASVDTKSRTVSVTAQHVSYDLNGIIVKDVTLNQASPAMAIGRIAEGLMIDYPGTIATNLMSEGNGTYSETIKGKTGIYCLLDPDKGIVSKFDAAYKRDNWDLFVMQRTEVDRGFRLKYRKNMLGVNWTRTKPQATRIVPVAKDEGGGDLYLPEEWVDSPLINTYPVIRMERLTVKGQIGKDKGTGDGSTWDASDLYDEMRAKAEERFTIDHADRVIHDVTVDFEMLGSTDEYAQLKDLERVLLYDTVSVEDEEIGLSIRLTVTELEWDPVKKKVVALKLSNGNEKGGKNVTGYNVQAKSIGSDKLTDEVTDTIVQQAVDIMPEYANPGSGTGAKPNTKDQDGYVLKGTGNADKVWKTDSSGVPAWRNEKSDPTPEECSVTFASQNNYVNQSIAGYNKVTRCGQIVHVSLVVDCAAPYSTSPGIKFVSAGMPKPLLGQLYLSIPINANNTDGRGVRVFIDNSGNMYLRHGTASRTYDINFTYIADINT